MHDHDGTSLAMSPPTRNVTLGGKASGRQRASVKSGEISNSKAIVRFIYRGFESHPLRHGPLILNALLAFLISRVQMRVQGCDGGAPFQQVTKAYA